MHPRPYYLKINFNVIQPSTSRSTEWFPPLKLLDYKTVYAFLKCPMRATCPGLTILAIFREGLHIKKFLK
jgi:hypothetical protein